MNEKGETKRQDVVQALVDYRDRDGNAIPRERLNGELYGLMWAMLFIRLFPESK